MDKVSHLSKKLNTLKIDGNTSVYKHVAVDNGNVDDDDYYVMTCSGVDDKSNVLVKLRVKRKRYM